MRVFLSYGSDEAEVATRVSHALENLDVQVSSDNLKLSRSERAEMEFEQVLVTTDAHVFLIGADAALKDDPKLESEWRSALRAEWDTDGAKPMIPVLIGDAPPPPFLRDRLALHLDRLRPSYEEVAASIVRVVMNPAEGINADRRAAASAEQEERLNELKRFAETLSTAVSPRGPTNHR